MRGHSKLGRKRLKSEADASESIKFGDKSFNAKTESKKLVSIGLHQGVHSLKALDLLEAIIISLNTSSWEYIILGSF